MNCSRTIRQVVGVPNSTRSSINIRVEDFVCRRIYVHIFYERCDLFLFVLFFWKGPSLNKKPCGFEVLAGRFSSGFHQTPSTLPAPLHCCSLLLLLLLKVIKGKKKVKFWCFNHTIKKKNCSRDSVDGGAGQLIALEEWRGAFSCWFPSVLSNGKCTTHYRNPTHVRAVNRRSLSNKHILVNRVTTGGDLTPT